VLDVIDGANLRREYIAESEVTKLSPVKYAGGEPVAFEIEVTGYTSPVVFDTALKT